MICIDRFYVVKFIKRCSVGIWPFLVKRTCELLIKKSAWYLTSSCKAHQLLIRHLLASTAILKEISDNTNIFVFENRLCEVLNMVTKCYWFRFPHDTEVLSNSVGVLCFPIALSIYVSNSIFKCFFLYLNIFMSVDVFYNLGPLKLEMCVYGRS